MGVIFTVFVPIMFPEAGKAVSDIGMATSPAKSKMGAMIAEQFVELQLKILQKLQKILYFVWYNMESGHQ